jgi:inorganic pyrophosphatase
MSTKNKLSLVLALSLISGLFLCCQKDHPSLGEGCRFVDIYTIECKTDLEKGYPAVNRDGTINAVIEIPAGTTAKWELNGTLSDGTKPSDGKLRWEFKNGKPRVIQYLGYPGNYGFIPNTRSGDGDPLDVLILGPDASRGSVIQAKIIGILKMLDGDKADDKIIAVRKNSPLFEAKNLEELQAKFPGTIEILETWFLNYKEPDEMISRGWADEQAAFHLITEAISADKQHAR